MAFNKKKLISKKNLERSQRVKRNTRSKIAHRTNFMDRRVFGPVWKNCVIPNCNRIITTSTPVCGLYGIRYAIGADTLFDGPFAFLQSMHEYRITHIRFDISHICAPWKITAAHPVEFSAVTIPIDTDADDSSNFKSFEHAAEHPGAHATIGLTNTVHHHRFTWKPTEPTDEDWRLVKNDNIVYLYIFYRVVDELKTTFTPEALIRAKVHVNFRGVNFDAKKSISAYVRSPLSRSGSVSNAFEVLTM